MLKARIYRLEQRARARTAARPAVDIDDVDEARKLARFRSDLTILFYNSWRHEGLTLEQRLALARDDVRLAPGDRHVTRAARELEIRILLGDSKIGNPEAAALRANAEAHFGLADGRPTLAPLAFPILFDEAATLRSARAQCPRRDSLPLQRQIAMLEEDRTHQLQERGRRAERGFVDESMDAFGDKMHEVLT